MLVLRLLLMLLAIICLMDGHQEVMSAATGTKYQQEASDVRSPEQEKPEPEQKKIENVSPKTGFQNKTLESLERNWNPQSLDRKKKKSKPKKKPKKKKKRPMKNKPIKPQRKTTKKLVVTAASSITTSAATTPSTVITRTSTVTTTSSSTTTSTVSSAPGECITTGGSPCIFPFKDGGKEYNECADHAGRYYWCATKLRPSNQYLYWSYCPVDGSCPLPSDTIQPVSPTPTTTSTALPTDGTSVAPNELENKITDTLQNLVIGESRSSSSQIFTMLYKKLETIIEEIEAKSGTSDQIKFGAIGAFEENQPAKLFQVATDGEVREKTLLERMFVLSTVASMKSVKWKSNCCLDCRRSYADTELSEHWKTLNTCYCYKKKPGVIPKTRFSIEFDTGECDKTCSLMTRTDGECPDRWIEEKNWNWDIPLYYLGDVSTDSDVQNCKAKCESETQKCLAFSISVCGFCTLLTMDIGNGKRVKVDSFCIRLQETAMLPVDICPIDSQGPQQRAGKWMNILIRDAICDPLRTYSGVLGGYNLITIGHVAPASIILPQLKDGRISIEMRIKQLELLAEVDKDAIAIRSKMNNNLKDIQHEELLRNVRPDVFTHNGKTYQKNLEEVNTGFLERAKEVLNQIDTLFKDNTILTNAQTIQVYNLNKEFDQLVYFLPSNLRFGHQATNEDIGNALDGMGQEDRGLTDKEINMAKIFHLLVKLEYDAESSKAFNPSSTGDKKLHGGIFGNEFNIPGCKPPPQL